MGALEDNVRKLIRTNYHSIPRFADEAGLPAQTVYSALRHGLASSSASTLMPIVHVLGLDPLQAVRGRVAVQQDRTINVPLLGAHEASAHEQAMQDGDSFPIPVHLHSKYPRAFLLRVAGESMNQMLPNGCYALVNPCHEVSRRVQPYAVAVGQEQATVKLVRKLCAGVELMPDSHDPTFRPQVFDFNDPATPEVRILGQVVWYTLPYDWCFTLR